MVLPFSVVVVNQQVSSVMTWIEAVQQKTVAVVHLMLEVVGLLWVQAWML